MRAMHEELKRDHINTREEYQEKYLEHHRKSSNRIDSLIDNHKSLTNQHADLSTKLEILVYNTHTHNHTHTYTHTHTHTHTQS